MKRAICLLLIITLFSGCISNHKQESSERKLFTTIYPIHFLVTEIIDESVNVISVYPPGVDAHSYEPTTREMLNIASGEAFFYLGLGMEGFTEKAEVALKNSNVKFIEIGRNKHIFNSSSKNLNPDPHFWFDPLRMIQVAEYIANELKKLFPEQKNSIEDNVNQLTKKMQSLDQEFQTILSKRSKNHFLVSHGAYKYWEERYNLKQIPISGLTATEEPSQKELAKIVQLAEKYNLKHVLFEQNITNRTADIIKDHLQAERLYLHNLEVFTEEDIYAQEDYFSLMKYNLTQLEKALQ